MPKHDITVLSDSVAELLGLGSDNTQQWSYQKVTYDPPISLKELSMDKPCEVDYEPLVDRGEDPWCDTHNEPATHAGGTVSVRVCATYVAAHGCECSEHSK